MTDFIDKKGRTISIDADECAYAHHNGKEIGFVTTTGPIEIDDRLPAHPVADHRLGGERGLPARRQSARRWCASSMRSGGPWRRLTRTSASAT